MKSVLGNMPQAPCLVRKCHKMDGIVLGRKIRPAPVECQPKVVNIDGEDSVKCGGDGHMYKDSKACSQDSGRFK